MVISSIYCYWSQILSIYFLFSHFSKDPQVNFASNYLLTAKVILHSFDDPDFSFEKVFADDISRRVTIQP